MHALPFAHVMHLQGDEFESKLEDLRKEVGFWEGYLQRSKYVAGDAFTLADFAFAPFALIFVRLGASFADFPKIRAYIDKVQVGQFAEVALEVRDCPCQKVLHH